MSYAIAALFHYASTTFINCLIIVLVCVCIAFPIFASSKQTHNLQKYCSCTVSSFKTRYVKYSLPHFLLDTFCMMHASSSSVQCGHRKLTTHRCALQCSLSSLSLCPPAERRRDEYHSENTTAPSLGGHFPSKLLEGVAATAGV